MDTTCTETETGRHEWGYFAIRFAICEECGEEAEWNEAGERVA